MEVLENSMGRVDCFNNDRTVLLSLFGDASGIELRELFIAGLERMRTDGLTCWISDFSSKAPFSAEDVHWIDWTWFPYMQTSGWSHWAIVQPYNTVAAAGMRKFVRTAEEAGVVVHEFERITEARVWMRELNQEQAF